MISVYAPTEDAKKDEKNEFYDDLIKVYSRVSRDDIILVLGDYNAKIGRESLLMEWLVSTYCMITPMRTDCEFAILPPA